ncbi:SpdD-like protein [Streptomyces sp. SPB162]|uniref:SpdD-like protein n=1 Tax=Streptomyces sp. SPB162 TaxID=2940560 RepID=UPI0024053C0E|nr:SpdD-like protein [Streptomyces sp. SPB162]MDF9817227.1 CHASE2 domain-containing sensor protein [Streptomyces sp. SPB162]
MLRPQIPTMPTATFTTPQHTAPVPAVAPHTSCACQHPTTTPATVPPRPAVRLTPAGLVAVVGGGVAAVLVIGAVLVSLLLAVAVTAASIAVCAVVLCSLLTSQTRRR